MYGAQPSHGHATATVLVHAAEFIRLHGLQRLIGEVRENSWAWQHVGKMISHGGPLLESAKRTVLMARIVNGTELSHHGAKSSAAFRALAAILQTERLPCTYNARKGGY